MCDGEKVGFKFLRVDLGTTGGRESNFLFLLFKTKRGKLTRFHSPISVGPPRVLIMGTVFPENLKLVRVDENSLGWELVHPLDFGWSIVVVVHGGRRLKSDNRG